MGSKPLKPLEAKRMQSMAEIASVLQAASSAGISEHECCRPRDVGITTLLGLYTINKFCCN